MSELSRTLLQSRGRAAYVVPCEVTATSPLLITVMGGASVPAVKIAGTTVALGAANALVMDSGSPIVLPIG